jgi:outer membrane protein assembly factor BamD (BamD/ComL family)
MVHELLGIAGSDDPELAASADDVRLSALTAAAWSALASGDAVEAHRRYEAVQAAFPHDPVARHMLAHAAKAARQPVAGN